jgi:hypothetical protein
MVIRNAINNYGVAKWIVDHVLGQGTHTTITAALAVASLGDTIFIRASAIPYVENVTLIGGVNLTAFGADGIAACQGNPPVVNVIIKGTLTAAFSGSVTLSGIQLMTNGGPALSMTGSNPCSLTMMGGSIYAHDSTGFSINNSNSNLNFYCSTFRSDGLNNLYTATATGGIDFENCVFNLSATGGANTIASGRAVFNACDMPGVALSTSNVGGVFVQSCYWQYGGVTLLTTAGTGTSEVFNSYLQSNSASAISVGAGTIVNVANCSILSTNVNAITGAGTLNYGGLTFLSSNIINTATQNPYIFRPGIIRASQQPVFLAYLGANDLAVTGNGANYRLGTNVALTKSFDQGNNFNTNGIYTAPYTGRHLFAGTICLFSVSAAMTNGYLFLNTTASSYLLDALNPAIMQANAGIVTLKGSTIVPMTAGDTANLSIQLQNGSGNNASLLAAGGAGVLATFFSGEMRC